MMLLFTVQAASSVFSIWSIKSSGAALVVAEGKEGGTGWTQDASVLQKKETQ